MYILKIVNMKIIRTVLLVCVLSGGYHALNAQQAFIDPSIRFQQVEGWGGSLCWWANIMGGYSDNDVLKICDWVTDPQGLNMNIFRFNIGGGDDPGHSHMRGDGGDMPGYKVSAGAPYDWSRDANQRKITQQLIQSRIRQTGVNDIILEAFSNSPPYWMTRSGCSAGSVEGNVTNLKSDMFDDFADYLTEVTKYYHDSLGITFRHIEPFNEPFSNWWKALGGQEGCYFGQADQERMIRELYNNLQSKGMLGYCTITAMDSNTLDECFNGVTAYKTSGDILPKISKINGHSYFGSANSRTNLATFSHENDIPLWQSESGPLNMPGSPEVLILAMAARVIKDMKEMKCDAWIDWQIAADQSPQWGLIVGKYNEIMHPVSKGDGYFIRSQFSRFIKPGYSIIDCNDKSTLTAISPDETELVIVICNETAAEVTHRYDLGAFKAGTTVQRFRSGKVNDSYTEKLVKINVSLTGDILDYTAPKYSVTTFIIPVEIPAPKMTMGRYSIKNKACGKYAGIEGASADAGGLLVVTGDEPRSHSLFDISSDVINGGFRVRPAHIAPERNFVMDVEGVSGNDRARIMQYPDWGGENQRFHFIHLEGDHYKIMVRKSMKFWSLPDNDCNTGARVLQMTWDNGDHSIWEVKKAISSVFAAELKKMLNIRYHAAALNVQSADNSIMEDLYIFNLSGETIKSVHSIGNSECSVPIDVNPGIYFVRATLADGFIANSKFISL
jgi:O-glycosyl hydrolase